jgi:DNA-binding GntR family transcriptional regulator
MTKLTLKEHAYSELRRRIISGELKPGQFLTERMLVDMLKMSRTPIRSALERLDADGLALYTPNKGLVVAEISLKRAVDFYDLRMALECHIVQKLAKRSFTQAEKEQFHDNLAHQERCLRSDDYACFTEADSEFHRLLARLYDNDEVIRVMDQLQDKLFVIALTVLRKDRERILVSYQDHVAIVEALLQGNGEQAAKIMGDHLEYGKKILI